MEFEGINGMPEVILIRPDMHEDDRGAFLELYNQPAYEEAGVAWQFAQVNFSTSRRGVLRGLHFQNPDAQGKLVSVTRGEIYDVAVDIRVGSPTYGRATCVRLSAATRHQLYVPPDFAHGFLVLSDEADVVYQCTNLYHPESEHTLLWNDPALAIDWPAVGGQGARLVSDKDGQGLTLEALAAEKRLPHHLS